MRSTGADPAGRDSRGCRRDGMGALLDTACARLPNCRGDEGRSSAFESKDRARLPLQGAVGAFALSVARRALRNPEDKCLQELVVMGRHEPHGPVLADAEAAAIGFDAAAPDALPSLEGLRHGAQAQESGIRLYAA